jgi:hypothetical protein
MAKAAPEAKPVEDQEMSWDAFVAAVEDKCSRSGYSYNRVSFPNPKAKAIHAEWKIEVVDGPVAY